MEEQQEIDSYITYIIAELECGDIEKIVPKLKGLASIRRSDHIYNEIVYLLKDLIPHPTSINLTFSGGSEYMGSRAYIHKNIATKLGLVDTIEIETKSG